MTASHEIHSGNFESHSPELNDPLLVLLASRELYLGDLTVGHRENAYFRVLGAPLIAAFEGWMEWVKSTQDSEIGSSLDALKSSENISCEYRGLWYELDRINGSDRWNSPLLPHIVSWHDIFEHAHKTVKASQFAFNAHLMMPDAVELTPETLKVGFRRWMYWILQPEAWQESEERIGVPFMLELPEKTVGMPKTMILAGLQYELRFDKFYVPVPGIKHDPYAKNLFNYLGKNYETASNLAFKKEVFTHLLDIVEKRLSPSDTDNVARLLDVGCGTGLLGEHASSNNFELYGVDFAHEMCRLTRERCRLDGTSTYNRVLEASAANMSGYSDNSFDAAVMSFVEIWLDSPGFEAAFQEIHRVLQPEGTVVFNIHKPYPGRKEQLADQLQKCGFSDIQFLEERVKTSDNGQGQLVTYCSARK